MMGPSTFAFALAASLSAQTFNLNFNNTGGNGLVFQGTAAMGVWVIPNPPFGTISQTVLRPAGTLVGSAWYSSRMWVEAGFDTTFLYQGYSSFALVLQDDPAGIAALGAGQGGLGYATGGAVAGIHHSLAIEFDSQIDPWDVGPSVEVSVHVRGSNPNDKSEVYSVGRAGGIGAYATYGSMWIRVLYAPPTLTVFVNNAAVIQILYDLEIGGSYLGGGAAPGTFSSGKAWVGFTGEAAGWPGGLMAWQWSSTVPHPCYQGTPAMGNPLLAVQGISWHPVTIGPWSPFAVTMDASPGYGSGAPYILLAALVSQPGAPGTALPFGQACFPIIGPTANPMVLVDTFGWVPAPIPGGLAPYTFSFPGGLVPPGLDLVLQAVTAASSSPLALGLTNAVDVHFH